MRKRFITMLCICIAISPTSGRGQAPFVTNNGKVSADLWNRFCREKPAGLFWFKDGDAGKKLRDELIRLVRQCGDEGLDSSTYSLSYLQAGDSSAYSLDSPGTAKWEQIYSERALALAEDLYRGSAASRQVSYDGVSGQFNAKDEETIARGLSGIQSVQELSSWFKHLVPVTLEYSAMRDSLIALRQRGEKRYCASLVAAMNNYRWIHHFSFAQMIVINLPSADLRCYVHDSMKLYMKIIAGQPFKRTPRFVAWCDQVMLYPYWNVPAKIAVKELLPLFKSNPDAVESMGYEVVDSGGKVLDPSLISWADHSTGKLPFRIRQTPGCLNALGVIRFNLTSPYDVYMHDTNAKELFASASRYFSHGCIRLERPIDLGEALLNGKLDSTYLLSCYKDQHPVIIALSKPVPVFVLYNMVVPGASGHLAWYRDIYRLEQ